MQALSQAPPQRDFNNAFADFMTSQHPEAEQTLDELNGSMVNALSASAAALCPGPGRRRGALGDRRRRAPGWTIDERMEIGTKFETCAKVQLMRRAE